VRGGQGPRGQGGRRARSRLPPRRPDPGGPLRRAPRLARAGRRRLGPQGTQGQPRVFPPPQQDGPHAPGPGRADRPRGDPRIGMLKDPAASPPPRSTTRIGIVAKTDREEARTVVPELLKWCLARGLQPLCDKETAAICPDATVATARKPELPGQVDLLLVLGGDGTLLSMARLVGDLGVPILGVNLGGLGFLTALTVDELFPALEAYLDGALVIEERMMLAAAVTREGERLTEYVALNDVVITKSAMSRSMRLEVAVDRQHATGYRAGGAIVSKPTAAPA